MIRSKNKLCLEIRILRYGADIRRACGSARDRKVASQLILPRNLFIPLGRYDCLRRSAFDGQWEFLRRLTERELEALSSELLRPGGASSSRETTDCPISQLELTETLHTLREKAERIPTSSVSISGFGFTILSYTVAVVGLVSSAGAEPPRSRMLRAACAMT